VSAAGNQRAATVLARFSEPRMGRYLASASGDPALALELYAGQARVSAALWQTIGHVEVLVRNAMHDALSRHFDDWFSDLEHVFNDRTREDISTARQRARARYGEPQLPGQVVAELNLGFWRFLLARNYDRVLWTPYLHDAFVHYSGARSDLFREMAALNEDRNAIAHHQRIADPLAAKRRCIEVAGFVCVDTREWIDTQCRLGVAMEGRWRLDLPG
jgi:hypothetical protein